MNKEQTIEETMKVSTATLNDLIVDSIQDIKGNNIVKLDLNKLEEAPTNFFIICEGDSTTQVRAIANNIIKRAKEELNMKPLHVEGRAYSKWVLVDFFDTVVHVFYPETRAYYELEALWSDADTTEYDNI